MNRGFVPALNFYDSNNPYSSSEEIPSSEGEDETYEDVENNYQGSNLSSIYKESKSKNQFTF